MQLEFDKFVNKFVKMGLIEALQELQVTLWNPAEVIRWKMDKNYLQDFGGTSQSLSPGPELIKQAGAILRLVKQPLLYARVDGVDIVGKFTLIELELIEPPLFLIRVEYLCFLAKLAIE